MECHDQFFSSIFSYWKFGDFFKKLTKLAKSTPEIYLIFFSIFSFEMTNCWEKQQWTWPHVKLLWKTYVCIGFRKPYCCFSTVAIWHIINAIVFLFCGQAFQFLKFLHNGGILLAFLKVPTYHLWFHQKINLSNKISCMVRPSWEVTSRKVALGSIPCSPLILVMPSP
jgi:hypothetical protein